MELDGWGNGEDMGGCGGGDIVVLIYCMNFNKTNKEVGAGLMKN